MKITFVNWTFKNRYYYFLIIAFTLFSYIGSFENLSGFQVIGTSLAYAMMLLIPFFITYKCYQAGYNYHVDEVF